MTPHPRCSGPPPSYLGAPPKGSGRRVGHPLPRGEGGDPAKRESRVRGFFKAVRAVDPKVPGRPSPDNPRDGGHDQPWQVFSQDSHQTKLQKLFSNRIDHGFIR